MDYLIIYEVSQVSDNQPLSIPVSAEAVDQLAYSKAQDVS